MIKLYITISALLLANYLMAQNKVVNVEYEVYFNTEIRNLQEVSIKKLLWEFNYTKHKNFKNLLKKISITTIIRKYQR